MKLHHPITLLAGAVFFLMGGLAHAATVATHNFTPGWATFGQVVPPGEATGTNLKLGSLQTQVDVKNRWSNGSIKFAVVTAKIPSAGAYNLTNDASNSGSFSPSALPTAVVRFTIGGTNYDATLPALSADQWLAGPNVIEARSIVAPAAGANAHPHLQVIFDTRIYNDGAARVDVTVENTRNIAGATMANYSVTITVNGQNVFSKSGVEHGYLTRWRKTFGVNLAEAQFTPDFQPIVKAKAFPKYSSAFAANGTYDNSGPEYDILGYAGVGTTYMPTPGGRSDLGPYPDWQAQLSVYRTQNQMQHTKINGDRFGGWPIHLREPDGSMISLDIYPWFWFDSRGGSQSPKGDWNARGSMEPDTAHQPSMAYLPYLLTGDRYYMEEIGFWASYNLAYAWPAERGGNGDIPGSNPGLGLMFHPQVRGFAWGLRNVVDAAAFTPDDNPRRAYLASRVATNLEWANKHADGLITGGQFPGPLGPLGTSLQYFPPTNEPNGGIGISQWQQNYLAWAIEHANLMGFVGGTRLRDRIVAFQLKLFTSGPAWPREYCCPYYPAIGKGLQSNPQFFTTMAEMLQNNYPNGAPPQPIAGYYGSDAHVSLVTAIKLNLPGAQAADDWLRPQIMGDLRGRWGIVPDTDTTPIPPPPPSGSRCDVNADGLTNVIDVQLTANQAIGSSSCTADINQDGQCTVVDVQRVVNAALGGQCVSP
jgi:hypothetical protein